VKWKRERYKIRERRSRRGIDPTLRRAAQADFQLRQETGVEFRNGEGLIGLCIHQNEANRVLAVALDSADFQQALASDEEWGDADPKITQNLTRRKAKKLAAIYGQVAVEVLQKNGHAIGCITLDLPPDDSTRLTDDEGNPVVHPLLEHLKVARERVERRLTR
jgi:hypothetical protein